MNAVLEGAPPISTAAKRVNSGPAVLSKERFKEIRDAQNSLDTGLEVMRLICGMFDTDGRLHFTTEIVDVHAGLGLAIGHIKNASELLFRYWGTVGEQEQEAFMEVLWDSADIVFCVEACLRHKKLPNGRNSPECKHPNLRHMRAWTFCDMVERAFLKRMRVRA